MGTFSVGRDRLGYSDRGGRICRARHSELAVPHITDFIQGCKGPCAEGDRGHP